MYVVVSKLKELLKRHEMQMAGDLPESVSRHLESLCTKACDRAKQNGRKTVRGYDL